MLFTTIHLENGLVHKFSSAIRESCGPSVKSCVSTVPPSGPLHMRIKLGTKIDSKVNLAQAWLWEIFWCIHYCWVLMVLTKGLHTDKIFLQQLVPTEALYSQYHAEQTYQLSNSFWRIFLHFHNTRQLDFFLMWMVWDFLFHIESLYPLYNIFIQVFNSMYSIFVFQMCRSEVTDYEEQDTILNSEHMMINGLIFKHLNLYKIYMNEFRLFL